MEFKSLVPWRDNKKQLPTTNGDFADPFAMFRREMSRVFDDFFDGAGRGLGPVAGGWQGITPTIDVAETEKAVVVTAELPGLEDKDFEVTLAGDLLTIKGEKKAEHEQKNGDTYYMERRFGSFARSVRLPFEARDEKVDAKYEKGVLTIYVPKPANVQKSVRRIDVNAG